LGGRYRASAAACGLNVLESLFFAWRLRLFLRRLHFLVAIEVGLGLGVLEEWGVFWGLVTMQALVRLARRSSLQQALPSFQQGFLTRAAAAQSELGGDAQVQQGAGGLDVPAPEAAEVPASAGNMISSTYSESFVSAPLVAKLQLLMSLCFSQRPISFP
jgi:hypothetical protein